MTWDNKASALNFLRQKSFIKKISVSFENTLQGATRLLASQAVFMFTHACKHFFTQSPWAKAGSKLSIR